MTKERILILGVTGMLGHVLFKEMNKNINFDVFGTTRNKSSLNPYFTLDELNKIRDGVDADNFETVIRAIASVEPTIIINCIGIIKQLPISKDPLTAITVNAQLPHRLSLVTKTAGARLIHISTDCVFDGKKGNYNEKDLSTAEDLYGKTKYLGEVHYPHCVTLRTSIIGHELTTNFSLVDWFMSQEKQVNGFGKAIYSGFPTIEMANIISNYVIPNKSLSGLYQVSSEPISKFDLLNIIKKIYNKNINIILNNDFILDRSMNSDKFRDLTGYNPPSWYKLVENMYNHVMSEDCYKNKFFRN